MSRRGVTKTRDRHPAGGSSHDDPVRIDVAPDDRLWLGTHLDLRVEPPVPAIESA